MEFTIDLQKTKAVIFDVDGTLYTQSRMRKKMLFALLSHYARKPWRLKDLAILHHFRAEREKRAGYATGNLEQAQYEWCADKGDFTISRIRQVVDFWMFEFPNQYLHACMYPGVKAFIDTLKQHQVKIGIYSDYKAEEKLKAMQLEADLVVCSTDTDIDQLKPNPQGLLYLAEKFGLKPEECLFIGDRQELDGECAIRATMPYLIVDKKPFSQFDFYYKLTLPLSKLVV
ncbi:HAD family hydrolase [Pontibacter qinzhouensis]|uniref:phosphoglycolate phosphatase n=1 Tax=Pontibacter qinzhouensis TaxID=2603253 RepID=A0A5C8KDW0_9BACT|nr:HAD family hydrolase [Pontibacter qinzhouensis]TXK52111.1 HAD family hydrolase [Pontibacter qinzhouensis]